MIGYIKVQNTKAGENEIDIFNDPALAVHHGMMGKGRVYKIYYRESDFESNGFRVCRKLKNVKFIEEVDMEKYMEDNDRFDLLRYAKVSEKFLEKHINKIAANPQLLYSMCKYKALSQDFISKYIDIIDFDRLDYTNVTEEFIDNNMWRLQCYDTLLNNMVFSEQFLDKHYDCFKNKLYTITNKYHLSDEFIDKHPEVLEETGIYKQDLSYEIVKKHKNHVQWYFYYKDQNLEYNEIEEFLRELINYFKMTWVSGESIDRAMSHIYEYQNPPEGFYYMHKSVIRKELLVSHIDEYSDDFIANNPEIAQFIYSEDGKVRRVLLILSERKTIIGEERKKLINMTDIRKEDWNKLVDDIWNGRVDEKLISHGEWSVISSIGLSEEFIDRYVEYLDLNIVLMSQQLSDEFLMDYFILLDKSLVAQYQNLSEEFLDRYRLSLPVQALQLNTVIPTELKKKYIK